jgi:Bacterial DNA-binding protein
LQALLRFRCKKCLIFRPIGLRRPRQESFNHHHPQAPRRGHRRGAGAVQEAGRNHPDRPGDDDHQAPEKGERIRIVGLGIRHVRKRAARIGRNPATGEAIQIKASKKVAFRATKELKEAV